LVFTPTAALDANSTYTFQVGGVRDIAGNLAAGLPYSAMFSTLDTHGPSISTLRIVNNAKPIQGRTLQLEALLAVTESDASVRFTADFQVIGLATTSPYRINATLPNSGLVTFRAIAIDHYGNEGQ